MMRNFSPPAARQDRDDGAPLYKTVFPAEFFPRQRWFHVSHQRMTDEFHRYTGIGVELLFKWENAQRQREPPPDQIGAPGPPSPELRADEVDVSDAFWKQFARQPQMKTWEVREYRQRRAAAFRFVHEALHRAAQGGKPLQHFGDAHDRDF